MFNDLGEVPNMLFFRCLLFMRILFYFRSIANDFRCLRTRFRVRVTLILSIVYNHWFTSSYFRRLR